MPPKAQQQAAKKQPKQNSAEADDALLSSIAEEGKTSTNNTKAAAKSSTLLQDEELFFNDPEQDEGFKQIVQSAATELITKYNEDAKSEFQKTASQLKWYQAARGWDKTTYDLAKLSQSQREDDSFFKNAYCTFNLIFLLFLKICSHLPITYSCHYSFLQLFA